MFGAGLYFQFQSRRDGLRLGRCTGTGTVTVDLPQLSLGEGIYQVGVALADDKGLPEHDWHDRAYRINIVSDTATEGPVHQARHWSSATSQSESADSSSGTTEAVHLAGAAL
jgi:hypothetical protein